MLQRLLVLLALTPTAAFAQSVFDAAGYFETGTPPAVRSGFGGELAYGRPVVQLRLSGRTGALDLLGEPRFWRADLDLKLSPLNVHPALRALPPYDAEPYLFAGLGTRYAEEGEAGTAPDDPVFSWGAGVRVPVIGRAIALYGEGRSRAGAWEARGGLSLRLTRGGGREAPAPAPGLEGIAAVPRIESPTTPVVEAATSTDEGVEERRLRREALIAAGILTEAERHLGVPYVWGGEDPATGFDCSGFVQFVYASAGIDLPRVTRDQARAGTPVPLDHEAFRPGDLLFFAGRGRAIHHVAIYVGDGRIIHAPNSDTTVRYDDLAAPGARWYRKHLVKVRRVF